MRIFQSILRRRRFLKSEAGSVTVEAAIWLPFWILFMFGLAQTAFIFHGQARALDVAQQATRAYAIGEYTTEAEVKSFVQASLASLSKRVTVSTSLSDGIITTAVTVPALDFGIAVFKNLGNFNLTVTSQRVREI
jgi:Flp pilus assembly protein TadG